MNNIETLVIKRAESKLQLPVINMRKAVYNVQSTIRSVKWAGFNSMLPIYNANMTVYIIN